MTGPRPPEPTKEILNIDEAALLLGVSTKTFAKVLREGEIPGRKIGREWKFARRALIEWVALGRSQDFFDSDDRAARDGRDGRRRVPETARRTHPRRVPRRNDHDNEMSFEED
ncbi:MAG: helix-turn-helix domain-containing protein [Planctomycetota bacterium JB042]